MPECLHETTEIVRYIKTNGTVCVVKQCQCCGNRVGGELPKKDYNVDLLPDWNVELQQDWNFRREQEYQQAREQAEQAQRDKRGEWWGQYNAYLQTEHWSVIRDLVLQRDKLCQVCFKFSAGEVHHISYRAFNRYGVSFMNDCVGVCPRCHRILHEKGGEDGPA